MSAAFLALSRSRARLAFHPCRLASGSIRSGSSECMKTPHYGPSLPIVYHIRNLQYSTSAPIMAAADTTPVSPSSPPPSAPAAVLPAAEYHRLADRAMDDLQAALEEVEAALPDADIASSYGVLSINLGKRFGHWVINKQAPNQEIWWSSPLSGPRRFRFAGNPRTGGGAEEWRDVRQVPSSSSSSSSASGGSGNSSNSSSLLAELQREMANVLKNV